MIVFALISAFPDSASEIYKWVLLFHLLIGSFLSSGGVSALNEYIERKNDKLMFRTKKRPIPSGRIDKINALIFGVSLSIIGIGYLFYFVNPVVSFLAFLTTIIYLFVYTPLKKVSAWSLMVGAVPGAFPPFGGWIAATGNITYQTLAIFCLLFFWQIPHFFSIAWLYKTDYKKAGFKMFMTGTNDQFRSNILLVGFCILTLVFSLSMFQPPLASMAIIGIAATLIMGLLYVFTALKMAMKQCVKNARRLLFISIIYIPAILIILVIGNLG